MTKRYTIDRRNLTGIGLSPVNIETFAQLAEAEATRVATETNTTNIAALDTRLDTAEADIDTLQTEVEFIPAWTTPDSGSGPATTTEQGVIELATQAEVTAGTDTERAVTPATLAGTIGVTIQGYDGDLAAIAALAGTSGVLTKTGANTWSLDTATHLVSTDIGVTVQGYDADTAAIAALAGTSGLLKKTAANTWTLDTTAYLSGTVPIANGGTGQTTAANAINALLPTQTSNSGKYLTTDGSVASWGTVATSGGYAPLTNGLEPPTLISDGSGQLVMVPI